jgi:hypothetical protein
VWISTYREDSQGRCTLHARRSRGLRINSDTTVYQVVRMRATFMSSMDAILNGKSRYRRLMSSMSRRNQERLVILTPCDAWTVAISLAAWVHMCSPPPWLFLCRRTWSGVRPLRASSAFHSVFGRVVELPLAYTSQAFSQVK